MNESEIRQGVLDELNAIAPELDPTTIVPDELLREQVDLDSFDWLRFLVSLHERFAVEIPESDYRKLATVNQLVSYVRAKLPS